jgi:hypothetical protein
MNKTLYVSHSGQLLDLSFFEDLFTTIGDVLHTRTEDNPASAKATQMGIFEMSTEQQARDCAEHFHGSMFSSSLLSVKLQRPLPFTAPPVQKKRK